MNKILLFFLALSFSLTACAQGDPSPFIKGQNATGLGNQASTVIVPYRQSTKINAYQALIETGNLNMLANGEFEGTASTVPSGWTCTTGTCTKTTSAGEFSSGLAAMKIVAASNVIDVSQAVSTTSGIQKQGFARVIYRVPNTCSTFKILTTVDSATQTTVPTANLVYDNTFRSIEVPLTFGSTNAGIKFTASTTCTGNIFVDGAILAQGLGLQNLSVDTDWTSYTATFTGLGTVSPASNQCKWKTEGDDLLADCRLTSFTPTASLVSITLPNSLPIDTTKILIANTTAQAGQSIGTWTQDSLGGYGSMLTATGTSSSLVYIGQYISAANQLIPQNGTSSLVNSPTMFRFRVPVVGKSSSSNVYSQASANTDWAPCTFSTLAWQGLGTVTNNSLQCRRSGGMLEMKGTFTTGTTVASVAQIPLPNNYGTITTQTSGLDSYGYIHRNTAAISSPSNLISTVGLGYMNISGYVSGAVNPNTPVNGNAYAISSEAQTLENVRVPISGWSNSNVIVGSFENVPTVPGAGARIDIFSVAYGNSLNTACTSSNGVVCPYIKTIGAGASITHGATAGEYNLIAPRTYIELQCLSGTEINNHVSTSMSCSNCNGHAFVVTNALTANGTNAYGNVSCIGTY